MAVTPRIITTNDVASGVTIDANARLAVCRNSAAVTGARRKLNFIEGVGVVIGLADDSAGEEVEITASSIGSLAPGSYSVAADQWQLQYRRLQLTSAQRLTISGTGRVILTDL